MEPTEDVPYTAPADFAIPDKEQPKEDVDKPNKSVLYDAVKYLDEVIAEHNTLDVIDLEERAKMTPTQQVAVHKLVTTHLRNIKDIINEKLKELR